MSCSKFYGYFIKYYYYTIFTVKCLTKHLNISFHSLKKTPKNCTNYEKLISFLTTKSFY